MPGGEALGPSPRRQEDRICRPLERYCAGVDQFLGDAGKESSGDVEAACEQDVEVAGLGHPLSKLWILGEAVAIHDRHAVEVVGEHAGRQQPGHAPADDNGLITGDGLAWRHGHLPKQAERPTRLRRGQRTRAGTGPH
jgi:hypothetical protein